MLATLSKKMAHFLVVNDPEGNDEEVLAYGAECLLNLLISDALLLLIGLLTHEVFSLMLWIASFTLLRTSLGGLHAASHFWCILIGTAIGASSILISPLLLRHTHFALALLLFLALAAVIIAPVPHKNKQHVQNKRASIKRKVCLIVLLELVIIFVLVPFYPMASAYLASGVMMASILGLAGVLWNPR